MSIRARRLFFVTLALTALVTTTAEVRQQNASPPRPDHHMEHRFDDPERFAKSFDDPDRDKWQMPDRVIGALALQPGSSVADIGAGTGYFSMRLAKAVPQGTVYSVDVEPAMLEFLRKRAKTEAVTNVVPVQASPNNPNIPQPVDAVLIVNTYHHLPNRTQYFGDLKRSLKPGGRIAIVDYRKDAPSGPPPEFRFEVTQIVDEMTRAGYQLQTRHDFLPHQHFLVFQPR
jgi:ubiquinone/menaquinone biosynthesis C-methylase UbiE